MPASGLLRYSLREALFFTFAASLLLFLNLKGFDVVPENDPKWTGIILRYGWPMRIIDEFSSHPPVRVLNYIYDGSRLQIKIETNSERAYYDNLNFEFSWAALVANVLLGSLGIWITTQWARWIARRIGIQKKRAFPG